MNLNTRIDRPHLQIQDLVSLKQQSISRFLLAGGNLRSKSYRSYTNLLIQKQQDSEQGQRREDNLGPCPKFIRDLHLFSHPLAHILAQKQRKIKKMNIKLSNNHDFLVTVPNISTENTTEYIHPSSSIRQQDALLCSSRLDFCKQVLAIQSPSLDSNSMQGSDVYPTTIKFDREGVLLAVGSCTGSLQIFDFDEFQMLLARSMDNNNDQDDQHANTNKENWHPVLHSDLRRSISCVDWSPSNADHLVVSLSHSSSVLLFDLSQSLSVPLLQFEVGRNGIGGGGGPGHSSLVFSGKGVLAGSENGFFRCWSRLDRSGCKRCDWNILVSGNAKATVVSICDIDGLGKGRSVLVAISSGLLCLYDLDQLVVGAMGTNREPLCVRRIDIVEKILHNNHNGRSLLQGLVVVNGDNRLLCSLSNGEVLAMDLMNLLSGGGSPLQHISGSGLGSRSLMSSLVTALCPSWLGRDLCLTQQLTTNTCTIKLISTSSSSSSSSSSSLSSCLYRRTDSMSFTLPGRVLFANPGESEVSVTHDLNLFLCGETLSKSCPNRSHEIVFDFRLVACSSIISQHNNNNNQEEEEGEDDKKDVSDRYSIESVLGFSLQLLKPYDGPVVRDGQPLVFLRTNLFPRGGGGLQQQQQQQGLETTTTGGGGVSSLLDLSSPVPFTAWYWYIVSYIVLIMSLILYLLY